MMDSVDEELKKQEEAVNGLTKYKQVSTTILAKKWTGEEAPYTNGIAVPGATGTMDIQVVPDASWTQEQAENWTAAMILNGTQETGKITLKAYGDVPTVDIPIVVVLGNEVEEVQ